MKYGNVATNGFHSKAESKRADELKLLQKAGEISDLKFQVRFLLLPKQYNESGHLIERECSYIADFTYYDKDGRYVVEDKKGCPTADYKIKRKLMLFMHRIRVTEV